MRLHVFFEQSKKKPDKLKVWIIVNRSEVQSFIFAYFVIF